MSIQFPEIVALLVDWSWRFETKVFIFSNEDYKRAGFMSSEDWL